MASSARALPRLTRHVASKASPALQLHRTYYSVHHPDPSPLPPVQTAILTSALQLVPRLGFTQDALLAGAKENNYREATLNLFPRGIYDLIHFYLVTQRLSLKDRVQFAENDKLGLTQKVKTLTWARLQANVDNEVISHWQGALGHMSLLENIPASLKELGNLADEIWYLAGDKQVDFGWYTKRAQLSAVYASTEVFMNTDKSQGFKDTEEFLDRRLGDVRTVGGSVGGAMQYAGWWAGNGVGLARAWGMKV
ncbi:Ubiquinone biosynthesis protein coq9, mitochondrial [Exophiala xenobiotica]|uniref:Ubiquinone biosynthesis protein n=1 Tax=Lithohypha guttulata TaxID=1690604 RepID=A0ABR0KKQ1_9EURO|nr:Ubiquinone biosynthesis protein coq9, mitochondrial [Lithohypha guttulata]KAK5309809.1 Ubiquinone biosynthesis protein coq9, mitochondrial [Exophiala xenobiotica]